METELRVDPKIMEKIQKLMLLANDSSASQGEIENATKKAQEILLRYNLSMTQVDAHIPEKDRLSQVGESVVDFSAEWKKSEGKWLKSLYSTIARFNMCKVIGMRTDFNNTQGFHSSAVTGVYLIGKPQNVQIVHYLCVQLIPQIRALYKRSWVEYQDFGGLEKQGTFRRGFFMGCVTGIHNQLYAQELALREQEIKIDAMVVFNGEALTKWSEENHPDQKSSRMSFTRGLQGHMMGQEAGENMKLKQGIEGGKPAGSDPLLKN